MYSIYEDIFTDSRMRGVFSERSFIEKLLLFEATLADVEAELDVIPCEAVFPIRVACRFENIDLDLIADRTSEVGFPVAPLLEQISSKVAGDWTQYLHWGATTQDTMDTALVLQLREAAGLIDEDLTQLEEKLSELADRHRATVVAGRSQLLHSGPISFGYKAAVWLDAIQTARVRVSAALDETGYVQLGGAVGTLSALGPEAGPAVRAALADRLGLKDPQISWHTSRSRVADAVSALGTLTATLAKIGLDVSLMAQSEVAEVSREISKRHGISSTMPQKRNLIEPQVMQTAAKAVRQYVAMTMEAAIQDHERGTGVWQLEWLSVPEAFLLTSGSLQAANRLQSSLKPDTERMRANLDASGGSIMAEALMMKLAPQFGRTSVHEIVSEAVDDAQKSSMPLVDALLANDKMAGLDPDERSDIRDVTPDSYLGAVESMIEAVVKRGKDGG